MVQSIAKVGPSAIPAPFADTRRDVDILVVDDDPAVRATLLVMMERLNHHALGIDANDDVVATVKACNPALIVLDLSLGRHDGIEVLRLLADAKYRGRIILSSGRDSETIKLVHAIGVRSGLQMLAPLSKPVAFADMESALIAASLSGSGQAPRLLFDLKEAIQKKWLELWYQPKVKLRTRTLAGVEALLRLRHPDLGIVPPNAFIPSAESDAYQAMTGFVIEAAARDSKALRAQGCHVPLAINASMSMIQRPVFLDMIRDAWPDPSLRGRLIIELTEDDIITDVTLAQEVATQLKLYDIDIAIDDFGAGYSSFARLRDLPFVELKLDKSFVIGVGSDAKQRAFCEATASLARQFGVISVAEGIETAEDLQAIIAAGFDIGQGYHFARPKPLPEFLDLWTKLRDRARRQKLEVPA